MTALPRLTNGHPVPLADVPHLDVPAFRQQVLDEIRPSAGGFLSAFFGLPTGDRVGLYAVISYPARGVLTALRTAVGDDYPALTPEAPQAHWFERELAEQWGVVPKGHPWLKPIRFHPSYRPGKDAWGRDPEEIRPGVTEYFRVEGPEAHEVAVGPVHAGIIEPGHFRFQCHGEEVLHLEIELGYQHRGVERAMRGGPTKRSLHYAETLSGDTTVGHALAYCRVLEGLAGTPVPFRAQVLRAVALELERLANHVGDMGALAQDVGYLPTAAFCGRLRGDYLNATAAVCGNRFGRGLIRPGGVGFDVDPDRAAGLVDRVTAATRDVVGATDLLWNSTTVMSRFEGVGTVSHQAALDVGLVGPAARACGVERDVRFDFAFGGFRFAQIPLAVMTTGDVFARAYVRRMEIERSGEFVAAQLRTLPAGDLRRPVGAAQPDHLIASLTEGWRGEICHVALTDSGGRFAAYKVVDPSFHNWFGLALALRDQQISDFPLNNKSFNLSYCGHDL
ncbi:MAG: dehydrogenase (ubiquinone) 30 kDa subunit [Gemmataceae bacterium]|nr:dehydrogenase (ubiquinone) 30 kDa subunit [Gemmataceae bacterium]